MIKYLHRERDYVVIKIHYKMIFLFFKYMDNREA